MFQLRIQEPRTCIILCMPRSASQLHRYVAHLNERARGRQRGPQKGTVINYFSGTHRFRQCTKCMTILESSAGFRIDPVPSKFFFLCIHIIFRCTNYMIIFFKEICSRKIYTLMIADLVSEEPVNSQCQCLWITWQVAYDRGCHMHAHHHEFQPQSAILLDMPQTCSKRLKVLDL